MPTEKLGGFLKHVCCDINSIERFNHLFRHDARVPLSRAVFEGSIDSECGRLCGSVPEWFRDLEDYCLYIALKTWKKLLNTVGCVVFE